MISGKGRGSLAKVTGADRYAVLLTSVRSNIGRRIKILWPSAAVPSERRQDLAGVKRLRRRIAGVTKSGVPGGYLSRGLAGENPLGIRKPPVPSE